MKLATLTMTVLLAGCATPSTGPVARSGDLFTITRQGGGFLISTDSLKAQAINDAESHCAGIGKKYKFVHSKEIQAGALGRWPESEVLYQCL